MKGTKQMTQWHRQAHKVLFETRQCEGIGREWSLGRRIKQGGEGELSERKKWGKRKRWWSVENWRRGAMWHGNVKGVWGGTMMWADRAVWHASSTQLYFAFSAVIKEMFMLQMMPRRGERRAQYSTLRNTIPSSTSLQPSTIPILILAFSFLMSPSFLLPPFPLSCQMYFWLRVAVLHGSTL